jgi:hypothetical protein
MLNKTSQFNINEDILLKIRKWKLYSEQKISLLPETGEGRKGKVKSCWRKRLQDSVKETFGSDGDIHYLDCDDKYIHTCVCQTIKVYTLNMNICMPIIKQKGGGKEE